MTNTIIINVTLDISSIIFEWIFWQYQVSTRNELNSYI